MSENVAVSPRTKHVDVRYHFVCEFVQDGFIKVIFVKTTDNDADLFNKNLSGALHEKHSTKMLTRKHEEEMRDEKEKGNLKNEGFVEEERLVDFADRKGVEEYHA